MMADVRPNPPPLEYGTQPSLQEKIDRLLTEARDQGVAASTVAPPFHRLLWRLKFDVPPPVLWSSFASRSLYFAVPFGIAMWVMLSLLALLDGDDLPGILGLVVGAAFFGLSMAWLSGKQTRRLKLSPWNGPLVRASE